MSNEIRPLQILVVDDDALSRDVLALLLEHAGYAVKTADSGDAAMQHLDSTSDPLPDVVLADIQMPGIAGGALADALRERCGSGTMLLAMSGSVPEDIVTRQFDGLLLKPFTIDDLAAAIEANGNPVETQDQPVPPNLIPLDEKIFDKLSGSMSTERLERLYAFFLKDAEQRIARMRQTASQDDDAAFRREAHALTGGAGMVGAVELQTLAASMEKGGVPGNHPDNHVATLDELLVAYTRLSRILRSRRNL